MAQGYHPNANSNKIYRQVPQHGFAVTTHENEILYAEGLLTCCALVVKNKAKTITVLSHVDECTVYTSSIEAILMQFPKEEQQDLRFDIYPGVVDTPSNSLKLEFKAQSSVELAYIKDLKAAIKSYSLHFAENVHSHEPDRFYSIQCSIGDFKDSQLEPLNAEKMAKIEQLHFNEDEHNNYFEDVIDLIKHGGRFLANKDGNFPLIPFGTVTNFDSSQTTYVSSINSNNKIIEALKGVKEYYSLDCKTPKTLK